MTQHPEDLPTNDSPAGSDAPPNTGEPDPAEVVGTEDDPAQLDLSLDPRLENLDEYRRETLDERLREEEPDRAARSEEPEAGEFQAPESGDDDISVERAELDDQDSDEGGESAEDAAVHLVP